VGKVVALGSVRSCGVTTLALSLAATWPAARRVLLVEADPAGGTLGAGSGWPGEPSLVSLAAATRRGGEPALVWEHCHHLPGEVPVLAAPPLGDQARSALVMGGSVLGRLCELDADVLVDCGRLDPGSPSLALWEGADRAVLVVRPRLADLQALASWAEGRAFDGPVGLVTVGDGPYPDGEITEALGLEVLARQPWDPRAAEALLSVPASARQVRLAPLVRVTRTLADRLSGDHTGIAPAVDEEPVRATTGPGGGRALAMRSRVTRAWRTETRPHSNGSAHSEASR
jgi:hypothetical protein